MTAQGLRMRHLTFIGPGKKPATFAFGPRLNVIFGDSEMGKSFIGEAIDFMLGGKGPLSDIPERVGYDRTLLGVETLDRQTFTLVRSTEGGAFRVFNGLHADVVPDSGGTELADQHNERRDDNLSTFLLSKIGLSHKRVRRNKRGDTQNLTIRSLARLLIVNEEEIIQKRSPLSDGNYAADPANTAIFKLLLTGSDDSGLVSATGRSPEEQSRGAQLDLLEQLVRDYHAKVKELAGAPAELEYQLDKLDRSMTARGEQLAVSEAEYRSLSGQRRELHKRIEDGRNRLTEITNLLDRFTLLDTHYRSDADRLRAIEEAGSLFVALGEGPCPLCGAAPEHHRLGDDCDGNIDGVINAARAEITKIELRQTELKETISALRKEATAFERRLPKIEQQAAGLSDQIQQIVAPNLRELRNTYGQLADKRGEVREALGLHRTLKDLEDRKTKLEGKADAGGGNSNLVDVGLSTTTVDKFAALVLQLLKDWHFPNVERVHFDLRARDLIINGKNRTSFGKGLRAITQAAFTIGLLEFCRQNGTPHPGFAILDSPLLSYREPEGEADDLRGTDLNARFFEFLAKLPDDRQVIIIENTDPPADVQALPQTVKFAKKPGAGRVGFFPTDSAKDQSSMS
jgi:predicted  nucleic acid-binding Zn-ribbon protein